MATAASEGPPGRTNWLGNRAVRSFVVQAALLLVVILLIGWFVRNTVQNLAQLHIASGFGFLGDRAGFNVQTFLPFTPESTYGFALLAGLVDTIIVSLLGIAIATIVGLLLGVARLSKNWLIRTLAAFYIESFRNIPPLLVILFLYFAVIGALPDPRNAVQFGLGISLSNRGFFMPRPIFADDFWWTPVALLAGVLLAFAIGRWARRRQARTGRQFPAISAGLIVIALLTVAVYMLSGAPVTFDVPVKTRFNLSGGMEVSPEFVSLVVSLGLYTAAFVGEIVRAGVMAVSAGQTEAASALGLRGGLTLRLVVLPQAFRVIIPPLTSEYLNLTKNSSLAVAIGFADLVAIGGSVLNQTGQSVEVVFIWMVVYLGLSLITSYAMNVFNRRMALVER
ncbi:MAG: amino acid ABC transporter permease [Devosia sp.]|nr:amino acid ABC transporter permease [Devosiaceae bacterium]